MQDYRHGAGVFSIAASSQYLSFAVCSILHSLLKPNDENNLKNVIDHLWPLAFSAHHSRSRSHATCVMHQLQLYNLHPCLRAEEKYTME